MTKVSPSPNICILRLSAIGDVCHATAMLHSLQVELPNAKVTWIVGKVEYQLLKTIPNVEFIIFDKSLGLKAYKDLKQKLNGRQFDVLLHMQVALRANIASLFINAKRKIGFSHALAKEGHSLVTNESIFALPRPHVLDGFMAFASKACNKGLPAPTTWALQPTQEAMLETAQYVNGQPTLVICPSASKAERNWLPTSYAAVADYAHKRGFNVILCGGNNKMEIELADQIASGTSATVLNLVGKTSLAQLLALLNQASLVIAPDTGPLHMAVTQKTPVIGLYAHSNPMRTGPYLYRDLTVSVYKDMIEAQQNKPLEKIKWGTRAKGADLMKSISIEAVKQSIELAISRYNVL